MTSVVQPHSGCLSAESISILVSNSGDVTDSIFVVNYQVNGGNIIIDTLFEKLAPGNSINFTFTQPYNFAPGDGYQVTAWIDYSGDVNSNNDTVIAVIESFAKPVADFSGDSSICEGNTRSFMDRSTVTGDSITAWEWDFVALGGSSDQNPTVTFNRSGLVYVQLTVTTNKGCMDTTGQLVSVHPKPKGDFVAATYDICPGDTIDFTNRSTISAGSIYTYLWNFDNGYYSVLPEPIQAFDAAGDYEVALVSTSDKGCIDTAVQTITAHPKPVAGFTTKNLCSGDSARFIDTSTIESGSIVSWKWDFGFGDIGSTQNSVYVYNQYGDYGVSLRVKSDRGCENLTTKTLSVGYGPMATFEYFGGCVGEPIRFWNGTIGVSNFKWIFGNQDTIKQLDVVQTFDSAGVYKVTLLAIAGKCIDSTTKFVEIVPKPPEPTLTYLDDTLFTEPGYEYSWYRDGKRIGGEDTNYIAHPKSGAYRVVISINNGCYDTSDVFLVTNVIDHYSKGFKVKVYPNPALHTINIEVQGKAIVGTTHVEVVDLLGRRLLHEGMESTTQQLDIGHLASGMYFVKLVDNKGTIIYQVRVEIIR